MLGNASSFSKYIRDIGKELALGNATEPTHYHALKDLLESLEDGLLATVNPTRIECGAPDFEVSKGSAKVGYVEAKDVGKSLDEVERSEQLERYLDSLPNLVLTDFLQFRWYVDGECRQTARLGTLTREGKIRRDRIGAQAVAELLGNFVAHKTEAVGTPRELALRMARLAQMIRDFVVAAFELESESGSLHAQLSAFRDNLIPDLSVQQFADMYAQTIAYGLFAARCTTDKGVAFTRLDAAQNLPRTNPFLRKLFQHIAGYDLDDRIAWLVDDLAQLLAQADMASILQDFGKRTAKEDPVVHFYETFVAAYDPKVREMRGVYYTPEPVVSYIVRSIDHLLKTRFNRPQGLADDKTLILDPAVGTATFLYMAVNEIYNAMVSRGQKGMWNDYVAGKLLPRLFGFELLVAPYAVAHLKLGLLLRETDYQFQTDQRLGIYLTNTLEGAIKHSETLFAQWITEEANAAAEIKREKPIMVVLGNPPYSGHSANKGPWAKELIGTYKTVDGGPLGEKNPKWLQDDYVKFIRFGQWRIERTGQGVLGFITNHSYLDNPTFRGMRQSLMNTFDEIHIVDLHGNAKKREVAPDGGKDENVFDIQQGVAIALFVKDEGKTGPATVRHADLWGLREGKYRALLGTDVNTTEWVELEPHSPFYLFVPMQEKLLKEYEVGWKVTDIFLEWVLGIQTHRDRLAVAFGYDALRQRLLEFCGTDRSDDHVEGLFKLTSTGSWTLSEARARLRKEGIQPNLVRQYAYRPFDNRYIYYSPVLVDRIREKVMRQLLVRGNLGLNTMRQTHASKWNHTFATMFLTDAFINEIKDGSTTFPLYLYPSEQEVASGLYKAEDRRPNLNPQFIETISDKLGLKFVSDGKGDLRATFGSDDIFNYAYAVLHSPTYRTRYAEFLKIDFPRLPLTSDKELFGALTEKGATLVALHLMQSPALNNLITRYPVPGSNIVEKVTYNGSECRVFINKSQYFEGVPPGVWDFHIGGYQVCQKWLKDRKGRALSYDELTHYQKVIIALNETLRLMAEIDALIPSWPLS